MKSILLSLAITLAVAFTALAQNDDNDGGGGPDSPDCKQCWSLQDPTCESTACPTGYVGAEILNFTAPCTDTCKFACKIWGCTSGLCTFCAACTKLVEVLGNGQEIFIAECLAVGDNDGYCEGNNCAPEAQLVALTANHNYRLYVRKGNCTANCNNCQCKVEGRVFHRSAACPYW